MPGRKKRGSHIRPGFSLEGKGERRLLNRERKRQGTEEIGVYTMKARTAESTVGTKEPHQEPEFTDADVRAAMKRYCSSTWRGHYSSCYSGDCDLYPVGCWEEIPLMNPISCPAPRRKTK